MSDIPRVAVALGDPEGLHQLPSSEVRDAEVAHLPLADELVEGREDLVDRCLRVERVQLQEIDVVGAEPPQRCLGCPDEPRARRAGVLRAVAHRQRCLRREQDLIASALHGRAEDLLRGAVRVDVGRVEQRDAGVEAEVDKIPCLARIGIAPRAEERPLSAEGARAKAQDGDLKS